MPTPLEIALDALYDQLKDPSLSETKFNEIVRKIERLEAKQ